jgi:hypothetical protein
VNRLVAFARIGRVIAVVSLSLVGANVSAGQTWRVGPDPYSLRHPTLPAIQIYRTHLSAPDIQFFETPDLRGVAPMVLDATGLRLDGIVICHWRDGMLGVEHGNGSVVRASGCPADLPVWSAVGDAGFGLPHTFIGVSAITCPTGQLRFRNRTFFFDFREMPGDPEGDPPPCPLRSNSGESGWGWLESQRVDDIRVGRALAMKLRDAEYARFYHGIRNCFLGHDFRCLSDYLHPNFEMEPWWQGNHERIGRRDVARIAWQSPFWQELAWCFLRGRPVDGAMTFSRGFMMCSVERYGAKYGLVGCAVGE